MAKLYLSLEGNSLGDYALDKERVTIGRRPNNDIHVDNLAVSGEHAVIVTIGHDSFLEDLNSTNGTLVNNKPVKKHVLIHNDIIGLGKYQLRYENVSQAKTMPSHGFETTVLVRPLRKAEYAPEDANAKAPEAMPMQAAPAAVIEVAPVAQEDAPKIGYLRVLTGAETGQSLNLNKSMTTLGKPGEQVAVVTKRPNGYFLTHVAGANLPLVNGKSVGVQAQMLNDHDEIDLAGVKMEFYLA